MPQGIQINTGDKPNPDRHADRLTDRQADRQTDRHAEEVSEHDRRVRVACLHCLPVPQETLRNTGDKHKARTNRQTDRQADRQTDRRADRPTVR